MSNIDLITPEQEADLVGAVTSIDREIAGGADPVGSVVKMASSRGYTPPVVSRIVEAVNTLATLRYLSKAAGDDRTKSFPIASVDKVMAEMYPQKADAMMDKAASVEDVVLDAIAPSCSTMDKTAQVSSGAPVAGSVEKLYVRARKELDGIRAGEEMIKQSGVGARRRLRGVLVKLARYFRGNPEHFSRVENISRGYHGGKVAGLFDLLWPHVKTAGATRGTSVLRGCSSPRMAPYDDVEYAVSLARACAAFDKLAAYAEVRTQEAARVLEKAHALITKTAAAGNSGEGADTYKDKDKRSGGFGKYVQDEVSTGAATAADAASRGIADIGGIANPMPILSTLYGSYDKAVGPSSAGNKIEEAAADLLDPSLATERNALMAQVMLYDFMHNDEVMKRANPLDVISAYNEIARFAPSVAENPAAMRSILRRSLEMKGMDPFELQNVADMEDSMRRRNDTRILKMAPFKND